MTIYICKAFITKQGANCLIFREMLLPFILIRFKEGAIIVASLVPDSCLLRYEGIFMNFPKCSFMLLSQRYIRDGVHLHRGMEFKVELYF